MCFYLETGYTSLNKTGEELCGDKVESVQKDGFTTVVLADGLGSGGKGKYSGNTYFENSMLHDFQQYIHRRKHRNHYSITPYMQGERNCILHLFRYPCKPIRGEGFLMEFDNPQVIYYHNKRCEDLKRNEYIICDKKVYKSELHMVEDDMAIMMSDGVLHAGVGKY